MIGSISTVFLSSIKDYNRQGAETQDDRGVSTKAVMVRIEHPHPVACVVWDGVPVEN